MWAERYKQLETLKALYQAELNKIITVSREIDVCPLPETLKPVDEDEETDTIIDSNPNEAIFFTPHYQSLELTLQRDGKNIKTIRLPWEDTDRLVEAIRRGTVFALLE